MTNMILVQVPATVGPHQVDDFPEDCKRSRKGSLHFRRNSTIRITEDEYNHLLKSKAHQTWAKKLSKVFSGETITEKVRREAAESKAKDKAPAKEKHEAAAKTESKTESKADEKTAEDAKGSKKQKASG